MRVPNCENAIVPIEKLRNYALSEIHPVGKHKAQVFRTALGMSADDAETLRDLLLTAVCNENAVEGRKDQYGQRYTLDFRATVNTKTGTIRSGWIIRAGESTPRLTTCYVL